MGFTSSSVKRHPDCPLTVLMWVDSVVVTGFIQHRRCLVLLWRRHGYELVFCGGLCQIVSFFFIFLLLCFFLFMLLTFAFVLFRGDEDGWWLCSTYVIWSENLESNFFFNWRSRFFSSSIVMLDAYLHSTWLVLSWCFSKELGA